MHAKMNFKNILRKQQIMHTPNRSYIAFRKRGWIEVQAVVEVVKMTTLMPTQMVVTLAGVASKDLSSG